jgi:hypothetical protein
MKGQPMKDATDIVPRLRRWTHAVNAEPASDLMDAGAAEIESLRSVLAASMREITRLTSQNDTLHKMALALRDVNASLDAAAVAAETKTDSSAGELPQPPLSDAKDDGRLDVSRADTNAKAASGRAPKSADAVNHPPHYAALPARCLCGRAIEAIQVVEWLPANLANVVKYCWRQGHKVSDGQAARDAAILDIRKAAWYAAREVTRLESMR